MRRRLNARCKGFLEVHHADDKPCYNDKRVGYLHRTARDFIESESYWPTVLENTGYSSFTPEERWANALLWLQKAYPFASNMTNITKMCLRTAVQIQSRTGIVQKTYLDEFCRAQYHYLYENQGY
jgi:hypothetical protein